MRLCSGPGCGRKVPDDVRFCNECQAERNKNASTKTDERVHTTGYDEVLDGLRKSARWQAVRKKALARCPMCARCQLRVSEIADHIVPALVAIVQAQESGQFPFDKYAGYFILCNIQGLCRPCHGDKTEEDKRHVGPRPNVVEQHLAQPKKVWTF